MNKKILVVEDQEQHMKDAVVVLTEAGMEFATANCLRDAMLIMIREEGKIGGVITDIFIPSQPIMPWDEEEGVVADQPCGLRVALTAEKMGLPFVLCTAGYHHGSKYDWIHGLSMDRGWKRIVDNHPTEEQYQTMGEKAKECEGASKNWKMALELLLSPNR